MSNEDSVLNQPGFGPVEVPLDQGAKSSGGGLVGSIPQVWESRNHLTRDELIAAAEMCLDFVTDELISQGCQGDRLSHLAAVELLRARWYIAKAEGMPMMQGPLYRGYTLAATPPQSGPINFEEAGAPVPFPTPPIIHHPPQTVDHSARRPKGTVPRMTPLPREYCDDFTKHSSHTWPETNDKLCLGRGADGLPLRPVRDNPQA